MEERVPHVFRHPDGRHTWMCPSRKKGFVWVLDATSIPTSWGDSTVTTSFMLMPIEDWHGQGWVLDSAHEENLRTRGLGTWLERGWYRVEAWP